MNYPDEDFYGTLILYSGMVVVLAFIWKFLPKSWTEEKRADVAKACAFGITLAALGAVVAFVLFLVTRPQPPPVCTVSETPIRSLSLGKRTEGSFLVGTGSIQDVLYYFVYAKSGNGWVLGKYYAERWVLVETDGTPALVVTDCVSSMTKNRTLEIHIPFGTIVEAYRADTEDLAR